MKIIREVSNEMGDGDPINWLDQRHAINTMRMLPVLLEYVGKCDGSVCGSETLVCFVVSCGGELPEA